MNVQKPLGWLQRFLYNVEMGPLPPLIGSIDVNLDWPLEYLKVKIALSAVGVGNTDFSFYVPGQEKHGLVCMAFVQTSVALPAGDQIRLRLTNRNLETSFITMIAGTGAAGNNLFALINGYSGSGVGPGLYGIPPVYVPAGATLDLEMNSAAGGYNVLLDGFAIERTKSYPLRLP